MPEQHTAKPQLPQLRLKHTCCCCNCSSSQNQKELQRPDVHDTRQNVHTSHSIRQFHHHFENRVRILGARILTFSKVPRFFPIISGVLVLSLFFPGILMIVWMIFCQTLQRRSWTSLADDSQVSERLRGHVVHWQLLCKSGPEPLSQTPHLPELEDNDSLSGT